MTKLTEFLTKISANTLKLSVAGTLGLSAVALPCAASAMPLDSGLASAQTPATDIQQVRWRGGWGWGAGAGFVTGAVVGSALANPYYYGPYYGPYYAPGPYYGPGPYYYGRAYSGDAVGYCMQRFRSYNPATGTYMGYDGRPHPCP